MGVNIRTRAVALASSLPRLVSRLVGSIEDHEEGGDVEVKATADAGDDGDTGGAGGGGGEGGGGGGGVGGGGEGGATK